MYRFTVTLFCYRCSRLHLAVLATHSSSSSPNAAPSACRMLGRDLVPTALNTTSCAMLSWRKASLGAWPASRERCSPTAAQLRLPLLAAPNPEDVHRG
jgi:hypothetical protein